jgi:hypothetical protein
MSDNGRGNAAMSDDIAHELRVIARLMENRKTRIDFGEQDAAQLRKAATELEDMRATLDKSAKLALLAVHAERAAILEMIEQSEKRAHAARRGAKTSMANYYDGCVDSLSLLAAAIKARGEI